METIKIYNDNLSESQAVEIADRISNGELAILPTDSVYAIVCDALNPKAIAELCRIKGINPDKNNLSIICSDLSMAAEYSTIDNNAYRLIKDYTPGPFTFLLKASRNLPKACKGRKIVGIRIPDNIPVRMIAQSLGHPLLCTSIKFDDADYAREPDLIAESYSPFNIDFMLDAGEGGDEFSTIVDCNDSQSPVVIREGKGKL